MPSLPSLKPRAIEKILLNNNFFLKRQTGNHKVYFSPTFVLIDKETEKLLEKSLVISFENNLTTKRGITMRKTITPLLKYTLEI